MTEQKELDWSRMGMPSVESIVGDKVLYDAYTKVPLPDHLKEWVTSPSYGRGIIVNPWAVNLWMGGIDQRTRVQAFIMRYWALQGSSSIAFDVMQAAEAMRQSERIRKEQVERLEKGIDKIKNGLAAAGEAMSEYADMNDLCSRYDRAVADVERILNEYQVDCDVVEAFIEAASRVREEEVEMDVTVTITDTFKVTTECKRGAPVASLQELAEAEARSRYQGYATGSDSVEVDDWWIDD